MALQRVGRGFQQLGDLFRVLELSRCEHGEADLVLPASSGTAGRLLQLSLAVNARQPSLPRVSALLITTVRAGKSTPAATVEVAKIAFNKPPDIIFRSEASMPGCAPRGGRNAGVYQDLRVLMLYDLGIFQRVRVEHRIPMLVAFRIGLLRPVARDL